MQAITAAAIALGLVYTAVQFAAWRRAQYVANFTKLVELQLNLRQMRVNDPGLARASGYSEASVSTPDEVRSYYYNLMQLGVFEIAWFSHKNGQLPEDYFQSWVRNMAAIAADPSFRQMWSGEGPKIIHDDFRHFVDTLIPPALVSSGATASSRG